MPQWCSEAFVVPLPVLSLPHEERKRVVKGLRKYAEVGFKPNELTSQAAISFAEEAAVLLFFFVIMGGPLLLMVSGWACLLAGSWADCVRWLGVSLVLALHPLSNVAAAVHRSWFTMALYKYFSYRFVWSNNDDDLAEASPAWLGAGPPHGVLPLANVLSIPAINSIAFKPFVGAGASVIFRTPFLRYMTLLGVIDVSARSITKAIKEESCVGIVPDGIAGIFKTKEQDEVVVLKHRKGLAKLALKTGTPLLPAYSIGNTQVFGAWFDPFGVMEYVSRKAQTSIFFFWGRFGLPLPRRVNITMLFGTPIAVERVEEPSQEQVDALHTEYLRAIEVLFNTHKAALGWGDKTIRFV